VIRARRLVPALALAALGAVVFAAPARAGTFRVSQCHEVAAGALPPRAFQPDLWPVGGGWIEDGCDGADGSIHIGARGDKLPQNDSVSATFAVPATLPGAELRTAWLDWRLNPTSWGTNSPDIRVESEGATLLVSWPARRLPLPSPARLDLPGGARSLNVTVVCPPVPGPWWCVWPGPLLDIRGATFELEEHGAPAVAASGPLVRSGAHAGVERLDLTAIDGDSGVAGVTVSLGGVPVGALYPDPACSDDRLPPCPQTLRRTLDVDTRAVANGSRRLRLVATDAAGNARTVDAGAVEVRNEPPAPPDPGGTSPAPLFPANPLAGRGHVPNGTHASERARVAAWLEPPGRRRGTGVRRRTTTVRPGVRVRIRGLVTDERGRPIGCAALAAIGRSDGGPWKAITGVRTRPNGRFTTFTRIGPSQQVQFVYFAYGDSTNGRRSPRLHVRVRRE
jgi:hypothetical protein